VASDAGHAGADISPLAALGVPFLDLYQDPAGYFDSHHTANDTLPRIDPDALPRQPPRSARRHGPLPR
jgi:carboxypeptidase Q